MTEIFPHSVGCVFTVLIFPFPMQKFWFNIIPYLAFLILLESFLECSCFSCFRMFKNVTFVLIYFLIEGFKLRLLIHLCLFLCVICRPYESNFILLYVAIQITSTICWMGYFFFGVFFDSFVDNIRCSKMSIYLWIFSSFLLAHTFSCQSFAFFVTVFLWYKFEWGQVLP